MTSPEPTLYLDSPNWADYALLDSGNRLKLEQFGPYRFIRPEIQAGWRPALSKNEWQMAHGEFKMGPLPNQGEWQMQQTVEPRWMMQYQGLQFWAKMTPYRHVGIFPEQAALWDWLSTSISSANYPIRVLNLFAYTGIATLFAAAAGAQVTHVDSSKPTVSWARENQELAGLEDRPVRWVVEDAIKYVEREVKRGARYDAIIMDPPVFGRGPKGEIWQFEKSLLRLLDGCRQVLSTSPRFVMITAYTPQSNLTGLTIQMTSMMSGYDGKISAGKTVLVEKSKQRSLEPSIFVRWESA